MLNPHWGHLVISHLPNFIFVISGSYTKKCEYYNLTKKSWSSLSEIGTWRMDPTGFIHNNQFLYVFGGWNNSVKSNPFVEKIERIKLFSPMNQSMVLTTNQWESIKLVSNSNSSLLKKTCMGILKINENKILLLGGDTSDYLKESSIDVMNAKVKYHKSIIEVKINYLGGCEIDLSSLSLPKPSCFTINKEFTASVSDSAQENFGCYNHLHEFLVINI